MINNIIQVIRYDGNLLHFDLALLRSRTILLFGKQEYFPHLQLFIVLHVAKRLFSLRSKKKYTQKFKNIKIDKSCYPKLSVSDSNIF